MYRVAASFLFITLCCLSSAFAQGGTGQLSGNVVDANGAVVAGVTVKLTSGVTAQQREAVTNDSGDFVFTLLPAGVYKAEITATGFRTVIADEVRINVTQTTTLPIRLDAATVSGMVTINAESPLVQQESSQVGRTIEEQTIRQLPLPTRNFQQLLTLSPGTSSSVSNNTELGRGDAIISVNGQRTTSNNVRINGIDANSIGTNSTPNIAVPATDSLQEFIVQTSLYDASQGRNAGGNVEAVTKSGGNAFHGNAYYFLRNTSLNANDFFLNAAGRPAPDTEPQPVWRHARWSNHQRSSLLFRLVSGHTRTQRRLAEQQPDVSYHSAAVARQQSHGCRFVGCLRCAGRRNQSGHGLGAQREVTQR